jgi:hypothetical protein
MRNSEAGGSIERFRVAYVLAVPNAMPNNQDAEYEQREQRSTDDRYFRRDKLEHGKCLTYFPCPFFESPLR